jgi:uncharacterized protein
VLQANVSQLLKDPVGATRILNVVDRVKIFDSPSPVTGNVKLIHTNRGILVNGCLKVQIETECSRCLELFKCPLEIDIEEEYFSTVNIKSGDKMRFPNDYDADSFLIDEQHTLDLSEAVRQYTALAIPMKPLCHQDCTGLKSSKEENGV